MSKATIIEQKVEEILPDLMSRYAYVLAIKNEVRGKVFDENGNKRDEQEYKPYINLLLKSSIVWDGKTDPFSGKSRAAGRHQIRYYDGCTTLFIDDQPKEKATIDQLVESTRQLSFSYGYLFIYGYDTLLKMYLDWCTYNEDSPYRIPRSNSIFKAVNTEKQSKEEEGKLEEEDKARDLAKNADVKKMRIHAKYLGIPFEDSITLHPLSDNAIRTEYRKMAKLNPKHFNKTYNDKTIEINTWIREAMDTGQISTNLIPNSAIWTKSHSIICDLSGLKERNVIIEKLVEFTQSQTDAGNDFLAQLKALYN